MHPTIAKFESDIAKVNAMLYPLAAQIQKSATPSPALMRKTLDALKASWLLRDEFLRKYEQQIRDYPNEAPADFIRTAKACRINLNNEGADIAELCKAHGANDPDEDMDEHVAPGLTTPMNLDGPTDHVGNPRPRSLWERHTATKGGAMINGVRQPVMIKEKKPRLT